MPRAEQLPDDLKELAFRNAVELTHARWKSDVQVLLEALRPYLGRRDEDAGVARGIASTTEAASAKEASAERMAAGRLEAVAVVPAAEAQTMERVSRELAAYIGPIAEVVVKRAAKRCSSLDDLYAMAAGEIETEADRVKFLRWCRSQAV
jgi:hypothetical protein